MLELDENYQYAMIGSSSDRYFWILSRTPQMEPTIYEMLLEKARKRGYNLAKLEKVLQKEN
ncbi:MAG: lipocalin family protein [Bacteroidota bacterium]|nr:lipocalin family protein [Bacteroidota bacterium]